MSKLFKFELRKLFKTKSLYICTAIAVLISFIIIIVSKISANNPDTVVQATTVKQVVISAISSSMFAMISSIFVSLFACTDYDQQTIKNIYAKGYSSDLVYLAKYLVTLIGIALMFVVTLLLNFLLALFLLDKGTESGNIFGLLTCQLLYVLIYATLVFAISIMIRKVGISIATSIAAPILLTLIITLIEAGLRLNDKQISKYWFENFLSDFSSFETKASRLWTCVGLSLAYGAAFFACGFLVNRKRDN